MSVNNVEGTFVGVDSKGMNETICEDFFFVLGSISLRGEHGR